MKLNSLLNTTNAYKVFKKDIENATLSHAYLIVCEDGVMLENYLKAFAKALFCNEEEYCNECRACRLIDSKTLTDVKFYPTGDKLKVADVDDIVLKAYLKPLEFDKKAFVLVNAQEMNAQAQNKL
jgi:DNA polymerase III gamma/tau subunit